MNKKFGKKNITIFSILTLGLMHTAASAAEDVTCEDSTHGRQSLFNALLQQQLQMQRLYNEPIQKLLENIGCDGRSKAKAETKKAIINIGKDSTIHESTCATGLNNRTATKQTSKKVLVKKESKQSCHTTHAPHWLLSHMQRSEQELQQQDKKINNLLKGIYEVLSKGKATYGVAGDHEDMDEKSDSAAEDAIKKATGNDQIAEQIKAIPSDDPRAQAYEELLKIYKDDTSSDYAKKGALGELQAAMIVAEKLNDNVLKMVNFTNAYKDLVTYCKEHTVDSDKQEVAKLLIKIYLPVHVNKAILGRITGAEGGSDLDVLRSKLIEKLQNGDQEQVEESLEQLVLTANFGPELLKDMEKYKDREDSGFSSFSTAYRSVIADFGARYGGFISGRDQQESMKALFKATIDMYTKLGQDDLVELAKDLATAYEKNID